MLTSTSGQSTQTFGAVCTRDAAIILVVQIFVEYVIKNAAYNIGEPIEIEMFQEKLDAFVKALPFF
jgi:hypothetical protein